MQQETKFNCLIFRRRFTDTVPQGLVEAMGQVADPARLEFLQRVSFTCASIEGCVGEVVSRLLHLHEMRPAADGELC